MQKSVSSSLNDEFERRGSFIAKALAEQAVPFILANDMAGLNLLINEIMAIDSSIYYSLLETHDGSVLANSFSDDVPAGLLRLNVPLSSDAPATLRIRDINQPELLIRDFSVAVMGPHIGIARVGILDNEILNRHLFVDNDDISSFNSIQKKPCVNFIHGFCVVYQLDNVCRLI